MRHRLCGYLMLTAFYLVFYGCIDLGPDYQRPDLGIETPQSFEYTPTDARTLVVEDRWWEVFGDRELNQYVEQALKNNWDIKLAAARVLEARSQYVRIRADRFPAVGVSGIKDRRRVSGGEFSNSFIADRYELTAPASYEVDLWSKLKKASEAAWADILKVEEARRTVAQTVVAETISLYLDMEAVERRLQIAEQSIKAFRESSQFVETRYRRGLTSVLDVRQARRVLAQAETRSAFGFIVAASRPAGCRGRSGIIKQARRGGQSQPVAQDHLNRQLWLVQRRLERSAAAGKHCLEFNRRNRSAGI